MVRTCVREKALPTREVMGEEGSAARMAAKALPMPMEEAGEMG